MKIRQGFVSNSSSSSFICDVCGVKHNGYDQSASEFGLIYCEKGHCVCEEHIKGGPKIDWDKLREYEINEGYLEEEEIKEIKAMSLEDFKKWYFINCDEPTFPSEQCPVCNFMAIKDADYQNYIIKTYGFDKEHILLEIKSKFKTYDEFKNYLYKADKK